MSVHCQNDIAVCPLLCTTPLPSMPQSYFFEKDRAAIDTVDTTCPKTLTVEDEEDERCPTESWKTLSYEHHATATATIKSTLWITEFEFTTIQVTDSERITWTTRPDELHASTATPMGTPVVTHFVTSRSTVSEDTMKLSSEVIQCLLAVVFVGSMLWLATFWRGWVTYQLGLASSPLWLGRRLTRAVARAPSVPCASYHQPLPRQSLSTG